MSLRLDLEIYYRTLADSYFADVMVATERPLVTGAQKAIDTFVASLTLGAGNASKKQGAGILVLMPVADVSHENIPGPDLDKVVIPSLIMEWPLLNYGSRGTGLPAEDLLVRFLQLHHHTNVNGATSYAIVASEGAIGPLPREFRDRGIIGYTVALRTGFPLAQLAKCALPSISPSSGAYSQTITLACATSGAAIYYTTDGTPPFSGNAAATLYSAPFALAAAGTLRVGAQKTGTAPSNVNAADFT